MCRDGIALDREEYAEGLATIAAPVVSPSGAATVALGLSCSARRLAADHDELVDAVHDVARWASAQWAGEGMAPGGADRHGPDGPVAAEDVADDEDRLVSGPRR